MGLLDTVLGAAQPAEAYEQHQREEAPRASALTCHPLLFLSITPAVFYFTGPGRAPSLHSDLGNTPGLLCPSDTLSLSVSSLRLPTRPSASFPAGVQQALAEVNPPVCPLLSLPRATCWGNEWGSTQSWEQHLSNGAYKNSGNGGSNHSIMDCLVPDFC